MSVSDQIIVIPTYNPDVVDTAQNTFCITHSQVNPTKKKKNQMNEQKKSPQNQAPWEKHLFVLFYLSFVLCSMSLQLSMYLHVHFDPISIGHYSVHIAKAWLSLLPLNGQCHKL